jgi:hypothetical protein
MYITQTIVLIGLDAVASALSACGVISSSSSSPTVSRSATTATIAHLHRSGEHWGGHPGRYRAHFEAAVTAATGAKNGCWDPTFTGGVGGAYQQLLYSMGEQLATRADNAVGATGCVQVLNSDGNPVAVDHGSVLDLEWFDTPAVAAAGQGIMGAGLASGDLGVWWNGDLLIALSQLAPPALVTATKSLEVQL